MMVANHHTLRLHACLMILTIFQGHGSVKPDQLENFIMLSNEVITLCDFYLHRQNYVYTPIFLLLVLHVFKRNCIKLFQLFMIITSLLEVYQL